MSGKPATDGGQPLQSATRVRADLNIPMKADGHDRSDH
jgi:hypothetical protein